MEGYKRLLNRQVSVFYSDNENHVSRKDGLCISTSNDSIVLLIGDLEILIPKNKIVRMEKKNG